MKNSEEYLYYNASDVLGVVGVKTENVKHQSGEYIFLSNRQHGFQWIRTIDLFKTSHEAAESSVAIFLK